MNWADMSLRDFQAALCVILTDTRRRHSGCDCTCASRFPFGHGFGFDREQ